MPTSEAQELKYAVEIATYGVKKFAPHAKNWKPLDTMQGVLSQIDNLLAGTRSPSPDSGLVSVAERLLAEIDFDGAKGSYLIKEKVLLDLRAALSAHQPKEG